ncbi:class I SAM-dependent methyltransferase [Allosphingosinicella sp.]|uniref:class I SAM-dependent methyltransferase n=1 Tax=Allosphingosinicella sp. TaxID=2823234 RepID=UPI003D73347A
MFKTYENIFQERADSYHAAMQMCPDARAAEFALVLEPLKLEPGQTLCDVPAGAGYLWRYVGDAQVRYVGVEPSDLFASLFPSHPGAISLRCAMDTLSLPDASLDHLISLAGLHHEPDLPAIFREMRRVLRPGGLAVVADVQQGSSTDRFLNGFVADYNPMGHEGVFLNGSTSAFLEGAGFRVLEDAVHRPQWQFATREEMGEFLRLLFGITKASAAATARAAEDILGLEDAHGAINLAWPLRRLVCQAV